MVKEEFTEFKIVEKIYTPDEVFSKDNSFLHTSNRFSIMIITMNKYVYVDINITITILYSPDIAPSDYHMFRSMTHGLAEQHFTSYEEAKNWVDVWFASKDEEFF
ncbi:hypothetical protein LAZ67_8000157 [Cordylochernes scorpioides]|uniref:Uncharacterized protein n=1 Tax=Cordylochernes scorpioides TaxID=51811 RepID=A0ABY6KSD9_9ARAC|nr:hypothetical protein LAZ67_8000157 [Cordylochernes scorpioides]